MFRIKDYNTNLAYKNVDVNELRSIIRFNNFMI